MSELLRKAQDLFDKGACREASAALRDLPDAERLSPRGLVLLGRRAKAIAMWEAFLRLAEEEGQERQEDILYARGRIEALRKTSRRRWWSFGRRK